MANRSGDKREWKNSKEKGKKRKEKKTVAVFNGRSIERRSKREEAELETRYFFPTIFLHGRIRKNASGICSPLYTRALRQNPISRKSNLRVITSHQPFCQLYKFLLRLPRVIFFERGISCSGYFLPSKNVKRPWPEINRGYRFQDGDRRRKLFRKEEGIYFYIVLDQFLEYFARGF